MDEVAADLALAVRATADALTTLSAKLDASFTERDLELVLSVALRQAAKPLRVRTGYPLNLPQWQPKIGAVDVAALSPTGSVAAFVELKWGAGTLYNCVWDTAKLGAALADGHAPRAFLAAGAPASDWATNTNGAEIFAGGTWSASYLLGTYAKAWQKWRDEVKTRPQQIVETVETTPTAAAPMTIAGTAWELRLAEVHVPHGSPWHPVLENPQRIV